MKKKEFEKWYWGSFIGPDPSPMSSGLLWEYFKRHSSHEFPREAVECLVDEIIEYQYAIWTARAGVLRPSRKQGVDRFERLWNGEVPAGTCPTCGGDKEVPYYGDMCDGTGRCPDCTEEKERRKKGPSSPPWSVKGGELIYENRRDKKVCSAYDCGFEAGYSLRQHEEQEEYHPNGSNCPNPNNEGLCGCCPTCGGSKVVNDMAATLPWETGRPCPDCTKQHPMFTRSDIDKHIVYGDERKEQRRRISTRKPRHLVGRRNWRIGCCGRLIHEDRRTGDEGRAKTLTGSLKAMRPQE